MAFGRFQDFLSNLVTRQRSLFSGSESSPIDELLDKLMGSVGEVSGIVIARQVLDHYAELDDVSKLAFFLNLEQNFNADFDAVRLAYETYAREPGSASLNELSRAAEPLRLKLLRRLNQTPGATHDLVAMRTDLLALLDEHRSLRAVDDDFLRVFKSWFGRSFLQLQVINWSTPASILERIIRYEAVHEIRDWEDLRSRIDPPNRRCFAFFHPALIDEPLIYVEVALVHEIPVTIDSILVSDGADKGNSEEYKVAVFYSISNCQPGLAGVSFGNFLIKQVVQELRAEFPSIKRFVTLSPIPGFNRWLESENPEESVGLRRLKDAVGALPMDTSVLEQHGEDIKRLVFNYLVTAKRGIYPLDSVARFHLGNGASLHRINTNGDTSENGLKQSRGAMVNYLYDLRYLERNHESYIAGGEVHFDDKLKSFLIRE